jgi:sortase (surface protein transpeptidase)
VVAIQDVAVTYAVPGATLATLITCYAWDARLGQYDKRLVVIASLLEADRWKGADHQQHS